jgi:hypothetical protein
MTSVYSWQGQGGEILYLVEIKFKILPCMPLYACSLTTLIVKTSVMAVQPTVAPSLKITIFETEFRIRTSASWRSRGTLQIIY